MINNWTASAVGKEGFAYSHNGSLSAGFVVPDYANVRHPWPAAEIGISHRMPGRITMS